MTKGPLWKIHVIDYKRLLWKYCTRIQCCSVIFCPTREEIQGHSGLVGPVSKCILMKIVRRGSLAPKRVLCQTLLYFHSKGRICGKRKLTTFASVAIMNKYCCYLRKLFFSVETELLTEVLKNPMTSWDTHARRFYASLLAIAHHCERNNRAIAL